MDEYGLRLLEYLTKILDGFKQIFKERKDGSDPESESGEGSTTYGIQLLKKHATTGGYKSVLVDRLATEFIVSARLFPTKAKILQVKAGLMQVDEPPLSNKMNQPTLPSPSKKQKRKCSLLGNSAHRPPPLNGQEMHHLPASGRERLKNQNVLRMKMGTKPVNVIIHLGIPMLLPVLLQVKEARKMLAQAAYP
ncbi:hypothetical protein B0H10DRAFT_1966045 [Mycena sp. CBHHK59/15]|nr:hypothetical protein B0H10DRAFT_1966045 [Mycena sp. CBHHK59/15]